MEIQLGVTMGLALLAGLNPVDKFVKGRLCRHLKPALCKWKEARVYRRSSPHFVSYAGVPPRGACLCGPYVVSNEILWLLCVHRLFGVRVAHEHIKESIVHARDLV